MNVTAQKVRLSLGEISTEVEIEHPRLASAIAHIFRTFIDESAFSPELSLAYDSDTWRANIDGETHEWFGFDVAVCYLEDLIAEKILDGFSDCLLLHSAAVMDERVAILLVGQSGSGKTTLALELVRRGMTYATDEFTVISSCGKTIQPFPRAATRKFDGPTPEGLDFLSSDEGDFRSHFLPEHRASLETASLPSPMIVFPKFIAGVHADAQSIDSAETCARLLPSVFKFENREKQQWPLLANLVTRARAIDLKFGDAKEAVDSILSQIK